MDLFGCPLTQVWSGNVGDYVSSLAWSPQGDRLAATSISGPFAIWETASGKELLRTEAHAIGSNAVAWRPDGKQIATGGQDGMVRIWDPEKPEALFSHREKGGWVERLLWGEFELGVQKKSVLIAAGGKRIVALDDGGQVMHSYPEHPKSVFDLIWRPKSAHFAVATFGGVSVWSVANVKPVRTYEWANPAIRVVWSPDGKWIAAGGQDGSIHVWLAKSGQDFHMGGYQRKVEALAWDRTSRYLATANGPDLAVWDCSGSGPEGRSPEEFVWHEKNITTLVYQQQGDLLVTGGEEGCVAFWKIGAREFPIGKLQLPDAISQVSWSPDEKQIAVATAMGEVRIFAYEAEVKS